MSKRRVFRAVKELCTGCRICELACALYHEGQLNPYLARIQVVAEDRLGPHAPIICRHCKRPLCYEACPVPEAMSLDPKTGAVVVHPKACIGCLECVYACPFGAIPVGPGLEILKCDLCGGDPRCVKYCPTRPKNSMPRLPYEEQSCLQYTEFDRLNGNRHAALLNRK